MMSRSARIFSKVLTQRTWCNRREAFIGSSHSRGLLAALLVLAGEVSQDCRRQQCTRRDRRVVARDQVRLLLCVYIPASHTPLVSSLHSVPSLSRGCGADLEGGSCLLVSCTERQSAKCVSGRSGRYTEPRYHIWQKLLEPCDCARAN